MNSTSTARQKALAWGILWRRCISIQSFEHEEAQDTLACIKDIAHGSAEYGILYKEAPPIYQKKAKKLIKRLEKQGKTVKFWRN